MAGAVRDRRCVRETIAAHWLVVDDTATANATATTTALDPER